MCVRIDDTCASCKGVWMDIFLEDGKKLPFDYAKITEGC
jgi:Zn-finger nucleic acid-binding protein